MLPMSYCINLSAGGKIESIIETAETTVDNLFSKVSEHNLLFSSLYHNIN